jgi:hypothetical protein
MNDGCLQKSLALWAVWFFWQAIDLQIPELFPKGLA